MNQETTPVTVTSPFNRIVALCAFGLFIWLFCILKSVFVPLFLAVLLLCWGLFNLPLSSPFHGSRIFGCAVAMLLPAASRVIVQIKH